MIKKSLTALSLMLALQGAWAESVLRVNIMSEPKSIDPSFVSESGGSAIAYNIFEGLMSTDPSGKVIKGQLESYKLSKDGLTYTLKLKKDSKWTDGTPVTAYDYVYSWRRAVDPKSASEYAFILYPVLNAEKITEGKMDVNTLGIKALDDYTLEVKLANPTPYFLDLLSFYTTFPVPKQAIEKYGNKWTQPENIVTNGPYKLTEWQQNARLVLEKNPMYKDAKDVKIDKVILYEVTEETEFSKYRADEMDISTVPSPYIDWAKKNLKDELNINPILGTYYYKFNLNKAPFNNVDLRKALSLAVDRNIIIDKILKTGQIPAFGFVPPSISNSNVYKPDYANLTQADRVKMAQEYLKKSGLKGKVPKITILYNTSEGHKKIAIAVAAMWKKNLGIDTQLENKEWKVMLNDVRNGDFGIVRAGWLADYDDPTTFLDTLKSNSTINDIGFKNAEYDAKLDEASKTFDLKKRANILKDAEKILVDNQGILPIYYYSSVALVKPYVKGYTPSPKSIRLFKYLSIEK